MVSVSRVSVVVSGFSGSLATGESPDGLSNERFAAVGVDAISHSRGGFFSYGFLVGGPLAQVSLVVGEKVRSFELGKALGSGKSVFEAGTSRGGSLFGFFISRPLANTLGASLSIRETSGVSSNTTTVTVVTIVVRVSKVRFGFSCKEEQRLGLGYWFGDRGSEISTRNEKLKLFELYFNNNS